MDGLNFASTEYGSVLRTTPERRPRTYSPAELAQQDRIRRTGRGWSSLTPAQTAAWSKYSAGTTHFDRSGNPFTPNGYQSYSALSAVWYAANGTANAAPANPPATAWIPPSLTLEASASGSFVNFHGSDSTPAGTVVEFWLQPLKHANRKPSASGYRVAGYAPFELSEGNDVTFPVGHGVFCAGYRFMEKATGRRSAFVPIAVSGVALALEVGGADEAAKPAARKKAA